MLSVESRNPRKLRSIPAWHILITIVETHRNDLSNENAIFATLHNADMEPTIATLHASTAAATLFQKLKDHANNFVQNLVNPSNAYCLTPAKYELREDVDLPENGRLNPAKPCRIVASILKWIMRIKRHQHIHTKIMASCLKSMCAAKILFANLGEKTNDQEDGNDAKDSESFYCLPPTQ